MNIQRLLLATIFVIMKWDESSGFKDRDWVDPHDMDTRKKIHLKSSSGTDLEMRTCEKTLQRTCISDLYLKRIIRLVLGHANLNRNLDPMKGLVHVQLKSEDYTFLTDFAKEDGPSHERTLQKVSSIFETAFHYEGLSMDGLLSTQEKLFGAIFNYKTAALMAFGLTIYLGFKLVRSGFTYGMVIKFLGFVLYCMDCAVTYVKLVKSQEIDNLVKLKTVGSVPPECDPSKMPWWNYIGSFFGESKCRVYHEAVHNEYVYLVPPISVLTSQFKRALIEPVAALGEAAGRFHKEFFVHLPWGLNIIVFPIILIMSGVAFCLFLTFLFKTKVKLNIPFVCNIEFSHDSVRQALPRASESKAVSKEHVHIHKHNITIQNVTHDRITTNPLQIEHEDQPKEAEEASTTTTNQAKIESASSGVEKVATSDESQNIVEKIG